MSLDFQLLFEKAPGCYLALASDLTVLAASDEYLRAERTTRERILGLKLSEVLPPEARERVMSPVARGARPREQDGGSTPARASATSRVVPLRSPASRGDGLPDQASSDSPFQTVNEALLGGLQPSAGSSRGDGHADARDAIEAAQHARHAAFASIHREMNSSLNAILGFAQLLTMDRRETLSERQRTRLDQIARTGEHLLCLILRAAKLLDEDTLPRSEANDAGRPGRPAASNAPA